LAAFGTAIFFARDFWTQHFQSLHFVFGLSKFPGEYSAHRRLNPQPGTDIADTFLLSAEGLHVARRVQLLLLTISRVNT
jgi:hypothetical protein